MVSNLDRVPFPMGMLGSGGNSQRPTELWLLGFWRKHSEDVHKRTCSCKAFGHEISVIGRELGVIGSKLCVIGSEWPDACTLLR